MDDHRWYVMSTRKSRSRLIHELKHGEEGGMVYKYDLPVVNSPIEFRRKK